jgi:hypothetical protein
MDRKIIGVFFAGLVCGYGIRYLREPSKLHEKSVQVESIQSSTKEEIVNKSINESSTQKQEKKSTDSNEKKNNIITETTITKKDGTVIHSKIVDNSVSTGVSEINDLSTILATKNANMNFSEKQSNESVLKVEEKERIVERGSVLDFGGGLSMKVDTQNITIPQSYRNFGVSGEIKINPLSLGIQGQYLFDGTTIVTVKGWF